jgi:hypothetical protein
MSKTFHIIEPKRDEIKGKLEVLKKHPAPSWGRMRRTGRN